MSNWRAKCCGYLATTAVQESAKLNLETVEESVVVLTGVLYGQHLQKISVVQLTQKTAAALKAGCFLPQS